MLYFYLFTSLAPHSSHITLIFHSIYHNVLLYVCYNVHYPCPKIHDSGNHNIIHNVDNSKKLLSKLLLKE